MAEYIYDENKFDYNINYVCDTASAEIKPLIELHGDAMDSGIQNKDFFAFEYKLNRLYESIRILDELTSYAEGFIKQQVNMSADECRLLLKDINMEMDSVKKNMYKTSNIRLVQSMDEATDRNGTALKKCALYNGEMIMPGSNRKALKISGCSKTKGFTSYESNIDALADGGSYRTIYLMDGAAGGGLKETIRIGLETPSVINYINVPASNCSIEAVTLTDTDGNIVPIENAGNVKYGQKVTAVDISLVCQNYTKKAYYVNKENADKNFWQTIADCEYDGANVESVADYDDISGLNKSQDGYNKYVNAVSDYYTNLESFRVAQENYDIYTDKIENYKYNPTVVLGGDSYVEHDVEYKAVEVPIMTILVANNVDYEPYANAYAGIKNVKVVTMTECSAHYQEWMDSGYNIIAVGAANNYKQFNEVVTATYKGMLAMDTAAQSQGLAKLDASLNNEVYSGDPFYIISYNTEAKALIQSMVDAKGVGDFIKVIDYEPVTQLTSGVLYVQKDKSMYVATKFATPTGVNSWTWSDGLEQIEKLIGTFVTMKEFIERKV